MAQAISLGLDIGVSSVGFSVLDYQKGHILELGSRLFNASISEENETRRDRRGSRRLLRRKKQRRIDTVNLFEDEKYQLLPKRSKTDPYYIYLPQNVNPYALRVKGLTKKLTKPELVSALYNIVKHRGISFTLDDLKSSSDYSQSLEINEADLQTQTPAQIQLQRLQQYNQVRAKIENTENHQVLLNVFPTAAFVKEARMIIATQRPFYPSILTAEFEEQFCTILQRKRGYYQGPGSEKSRTDYGIYKTDGRTLDNLFEELIGHDKVCSKELRASAASYTAQEFNLLSDLNNLTITTYEDGKMPTADKLQLIDQLRQAKGNPSVMKLIKKISHCEDQDIRGYRVDENDKPELHSLAIYRKMRRAFLKQDIEINTWSTDFLDDLSFIMTLNTEDGEIRKQLHQRLQPKYDFLDDSLIQAIIDNKAAFEIKSNNKWHRFSIKTMRELIPEMQKRPVEQMTLLQEKGWSPHDQHRFQDDEYLPYRKITADIYNPVAAKSVREALKIVNAVKKKYGQPDYIVVEMPRDKNEKDMKKYLDQLKKNNRKIKDQAMQEFIASVGSKQDVDDGLRKQGGKLYTKIRLWYEQQRKCLYSGRTIDAYDLLHYPENFEIDHIIPQSVSFDDSLNNKTLCYAEMNQQKDKQTPYAFFNLNHGQGWKKFAAQVLDNPNFSKAKRDNYLCDEDLSDLEVRQRFISRNLVDTRYSSRVVLNSLQEFYREKNQKTKVTVIRGKFTSNMRKHWHLPKSRETYHHHAVDATIIAATPFLKLWKKTGGTIFPVKVSEHTIDIKTGAILDDKEYDQQLLNLPDSHLVTELQEIEPRVQFSHQIDKKMNRKISNDTIYSVRNGQLAKDKQPADYIIAKIKNIYDAADYAKFKKVYDKDPSKFLMAKLDPQSFALLEQVLQQYPDQIEEIDQSGKVKPKNVSPFELYRRDHGFLHKYAKHNNGPIIKQLKYYDKKMGSKISVTPQNARNKQVILQSLKPWRTDVYLDEATGEYQIMGINHSDLSCVHGTFGIKRADYLEIKAREGVQADAKFLFSLYRKNRIKVQNLKTKEQMELLFWSRTTSNKNYAELKLLDSYDNYLTKIPLYGNAKEGKQIIKPLVPKDCKLWKVNTDILGNPYYLEQEEKQPQNILD